MLQGDVLVSNIWKHLDKHHIITELQHGFRRQRSCESQLLHVSHDIAKTFNQSNQVDAAVLDFSKAFDKVLHQRPIRKL